MHCNSLLNISLQWKMFFLGRMIVSKYLILCNYFKKYPMLAVYISVCHDKLITSYLQVRMDFSLFWGSSLPGQFHSGKISSMKVRQPFPVENMAFPG